MFLGLIVWSLERKFPRVTHISTEQLQEKIENQPSENLPPREGDEREGNPRFRISYRFHKKPMASKCPMLERSAVTEK